MSAIIIQYLYSHLYLQMFNSNNIFDIVHSLDTADNCHRRGSNLKSMLYQLLPKEMYHLTTSAYSNYQMDIEL